MKKFVIFCLKSLISSLLIFFSWVTFTSFQSLEFEWEGNYSTIALGSSFLLGMILFLFVIDLKRLYVFGHEFAHWFFAKLHLRKTGKFNVSKNGGSVEIQNPNLLITLAPYFFPTYTFFWLPSFFFFKYLFRPTQWNMPIFFYGIGMTFAFHLAMTMKALKVEQSDLKRYGLPLSASTILFSNLIIIYLSLHTIQLSLKSGSKFWIDKFMQNGEGLIAVSSKYLRELLSLI